MEQDRDDRNGRAGGREGGGEGLRECAWSCWGSGGFDTQRSGDLRQQRFIRAVSQPPLRPRHGHPTLTSFKDDAVRQPISLVALFISYICGTIVGLVG